MNSHAFAFLVTAETDRELSPSDLEYLRDVIAPHLRRGVAEANAHTFPVVSLSLHACPSLEVLAQTLNVGSTTETEDGRQASAPCDGD